MNARAETKPVIAGARQKDPLNRRIVCHETLEDRPLETYRDLIARAVAWFRASNKAW